MNKIFTLLLLAWMASSNNLSAQVETPKTRIVKINVTPWAREQLSPFVGDTMVLTKFGTAIECRTGECFSTSYMAWFQPITMVHKTPCAVTAMGKAQDALCHGDSGSLSLTVTGGVSPYCYKWSNGATTRDLGRMSAGAYCVTVTDVNGCTVVACDIIEKPAVLTAAGEAKNVLCHSDSTGSMSLTVTGGTAPYNYAWSNGATTGDLTGVKPGNYTVTVTDANGCTTSVGAVLTQPDTLRATTRVTDADCDSKTGEVILTVAGGVAPYAYKWSNGVTTRDLVDAQPGSYTVTVTDANGCTATVTASIAQPSCGLKLAVFGEGMLSLSLFKEDKAPLNNAVFRTFRFGVESRPWFLPLDINIWLGFHPASNFDWPSEVEPDADGWCPCDKKLQQPMISVGVRLSYRIPLGSIAGGELGIRPYASFDRWVTRPPVPQGFEGRYRLPGAGTVGAFAYWQSPLRKRNGELASATVSLSTGLGWQFLEGSRQGLEAQVLVAKISFGGGAKPGKEETPPRRRKKQAN